MSIDITKTLTELCDLPGPAGFEEPVTKHVQQLLGPLMDEVWIDVMGNVIGVRKCGKENAKKLLLDAHIDEVGIIVTGAEEGFLKFAALGGTDARILPASGIKILTDPPRFGVVSVLPPHILKKEDTDRVTQIEDMVIDAGLTQEEAEKLITPGTPGVLEGKTELFGENGIRGKALDDRAGLVAIMRAIELLGDFKPDFDLYVMASVQEEVGVRGATAGAYSVNPDHCIVVEVGFAKTPDTKSTETDVKMGEGVIISRGPNMNKVFTEKTVELARENDIKHQIEVVAGGSSGTNARAIQISRGGVATALFNIPLKYMHTANEVISLDDLEATAQLISKIILSGI